MNTKKCKEIRAYLQNVIKGTQFEGHVFAVGGCCRDEMLGLPIKDLDLVVTIKDGGLLFAQWLADNNYTAGSIVTYPRFGTAQFTLKQFPEEQLEVVQTRAEVYSPDSRKPETSYASIKEDCLRRDLTINAIYYDITNEKMIDVCGTSFDDLRNHVIVTPCDPNQTYIDDPLRILRCIRFACRFGWNIDPNVYASMCKNVDRLSVISIERITDEFMKIIRSDNATTGVQMLIDIKAMKYILPHISFDTINNDVILENLHTDVQRIAALCMFDQYAFQDINHVSLDMKTIKNIWNLIVLARDSKNINSIRDVRQFVYKCKDEETFKAVNEIRSLLSMYNEVLDSAKFEDFSMFFNYKLPITGNDIIEVLNISPGPAVKMVLDVSMSKVFECPNFGKTELINYIKSL